MFQVLRVQKLKSMASIRRSLDHSFREKETLNADSNLAHKNNFFGSNSTKLALAKFRAIYNDIKKTKKIRLNAVLCVEHLITASPDFFEQKTLTEQNNYFKDSLKFLREKWGAENVINGGVHRDEKSPHMFVYIIPRDDKTGNLNCRKWLGESDALSNMQTQFNNEVANKYGLKRGLKNSKAKHQSLKKYYAKQKLIESAEKAPGLTKKDMLLSAMGIKTKNVKKIEELANVASRARVYAQQQQSKTKQAIQSLTISEKEAQNRAVELEIARGEFSKENENLFYKKAIKVQKMIDVQESKNTLIDELKVSLNTEKSKNEALLSELQHETSKNSQSKKTLKMTL